MNENDRFRTNSTNAYTNSNVGENDGSANNGSEITVPKDIVEKCSVDEVLQVERLGLIRIRSS